MMWVYQPVIKKLLLETHNSYRLSRAVVQTSTRMMRGVGVALLALLALIHMSAGLSCPRPCDRNRCTKVQCNFGVGKDLCSCCPRCLKGLGEECGGIWNHGGSCGKGLTCSNPPNFTTQEPGKCEPQT
ncbi:venom protein 302 isoform X5 [Procambarus clarkii]|uniref:venom protein 302 isoform X5 n=1 Tax=Procambarus clarkii TaxID=6728 RepID=UPI001E677781|nr:venom protein 302-like [Procambarus clarkii]